MITIYVMKTLKETLEIFIEKHAIKLIDSALDELWIKDKEYAESVYEELFFVFEEHGEVLYSEHGSSLQEGFGDAVDAFLGLVDAVGWLCKSVSQKGKGVEIILSHADHADYRLVLEEVCGDWIQEDIYQELNKFSQQHCELSVVYLPLDDPYRLIALPNNAAEELSEIIDGYIKPYVMN